MSSYKASRKNELEINLQPGFCAYFRGPGRLKMTKGTAYLFGLLLEPSMEIQLRKYAIYPLETSEGASLEYQTTSSGHSVHRGLAISQNWIESVNKITKGPFGQTVLVLGAVDGGKTSFTTYLANVFLQRFKEPVVIIDTDVGQSKIGPPGTLGLGLATEPIIGLEELQTKKLYFVGAKSPSGNFLPITLGLSSLMEFANSLKPRAILVDTSGFVVGPAAAALKLAKAEITRPEWIIGLQRQGEIESLLESYKSIAKVLRCAVPQRLQPLSREERIARRTMTWQSQPLKSHYEFQVDELALIGSPFIAFEQVDSPLSRQLEDLLGPCLISQSLHQTSILFQGEFPTQRILAVAEQIKSVIAGFPVRHFLHYYVGLLNGSFETLGLGFIRNVDCKERKISVETTVSKNSLKAVKMIRLGRLRVDQQRDELPPCRPLIADPFA